MASSPDSSPESAFWPLRNPSNGWGVLPSSAAQRSLMLFPWPARGPWADMASYAVIPQRWFAAAYGSDFGFGQKYKQSIPVILYSSPWLWQTSPAREAAPSMTVPDVMCLPSARCVSNALRSAADGVRRFPHDKGKHSCIQSLLTRGGSHGPGGSGRCCDGRSAGGRWESAVFPNFQIWVVTENRKPSSKTTSQTEPDDRKTVESYSESWQHHTMAALRALSAPP